MRTEVIDEIPAGVLVLDADGVILDVNRSFEGMLAVPREQLVGATFTSLMTRSSALLHETRWRQALGLHGDLAEASLSLVGRDAPVPVLVNANTRADGTTLVVVFGAGGRTAYERGLVADRRRAQSSTARITALQEASEAFALIETEQELITELAERGRRAMDAGRATVVLLDDDGSPTAVGGEHPLGRAWIDGFESFARGTVAWESLDPIPLDPEFVTGLRAQRVEALTSVAIEHAGHELGRLACFYPRARRVDADALQLQEAIARLGAAVVVRLRLESNLRRLAHFDPLTGLANRYQVMTRAEELLHGENTQGVAAIFIDLDQFKDVNDRYGHRVGDEVLIDAARRIQGAVRGEDLVGRLGGDEFLVVAVADRVAAQAIGDRILAAFSRPAPDLPHVTGSVGLTWLAPDQPATNADLLVNGADQAMYAAKAAGRNRVAAVDWSPRET